MAKKAKKYESLTRELSEIKLWFALIPEVCSAIEWVLGKMTSDTEPRETEISLKHKFPAFGNYPSPAKFRNVILTEYLRKTSK